MVYDESSHCVYYGLSGRNDSGIFRRCKSEQFRNSNRIIPVGSDVVRIVGPGLDWIGSNLVWFVTEDYSNYDMFMGSTDGKLQVQTQIKNSMPFEVTVDSVEGSIGDQIS